MSEQAHDSSVQEDLFPQEIAGLPDATPSSIMPLSDGEVLSLRIMPVRKTIAGAAVRMLSYNGSIPGPLLRVRQGTSVTVEVTNDADLEQTVHWHGLRLDNRFDGVPYVTQPAIPVGGRFTYELQFPDPGLYWYHPHFREDYGQEMGLSGQIIVDPVDPEYWPAVNREIPLTVDDVLLEHGRMPAFHRSGPTHTMMGRFGTVMLVGGETDPSFDVEVGNVVRLHLTNTANTRIFNLGVGGASLKLVGGDSGRYEREELVDSVMIAPSERAIVDLLVDRPGNLVLEQRTPDGTTSIATLVVGERSASHSFADAFAKLRTDPELGVERAALATHLHRAPDKHLTLVGSMDMSEMDMGDMDMGGTDMGGTDMGGTDMGGTDASRTEHHDMPGHHAAGADAGDGLEWTDTMPEMNVMSDRSNMLWELVDAATGASNQDISWRFHVGDRVKIRLDNAAGSDHEMHHPFHVHGAGRFLVLARGGVPEPNLVWKDTVLVRAGQVVDVLLEVTNPGRWMAHCHIAEHNESGMMFSFDVLPEPRTTKVLP
jgi:FtsP/CotA-like multicopper oxidase with cupredoxin domain